MSMEESLKNDEITQRPTPPPFDPQFPYSLVISLPLPSHHLASSALRALQVDSELSPLVRRTFRLAQPDSSAPGGVSIQDYDGEGSDEERGPTVLVTEYKATTNRMLRVAVNGLMESLVMILGVMEELDVDVLSAELGKV